MYLITESHNEEEAGRQGRGGKIDEWALAAVLGAGLLILYIGLNTSFSFRFEDRQGYADYPMLAEAFVSGQLYLKVPVDPRRLEAADPVDPSLPYPFMGDAIIWKGKYYLGVGPLPAVVRAVILKLTGISYPTGLVIVVGLLGMLLSLAAILSTIKMAFFRNSPRWVSGFVLAAFALSGPQLYMASRPVVNHESTVLGGFFVLGASALLVYGLTHFHRLYLSLAVSSALFGMAILCRVWLGVYPLIFFLVLCFFSLRQPALQQRFWKLTAAFLLPLGGFIALQLLYNFLRFGYPFEFGTRQSVAWLYDIYLYCVRNEGFFRIQHVPLQLYNYFLSPPLITGKIGILRYPVDTIFVGDIMVVREFISSVFIMVPIILLSLPFPLFLRDKPRNWEFSVIISYCALAPLAFVIVLLFYAFASARFLSDFTPLFFVLIFYNLVIIWSKIQHSVKLRRLMVGGLCALFLVNGLMGLFLAVTGMTAYR